MARLVVLGMMGRCLFGGQSWLCLNWLRGLSRLGHEVWYVEDDATWPYDPRVDAISDDPGYAVAHIDGLLKRVGLEGRWAYRALYRSADEVYGLPLARLLELYRGCDALPNLCGATVLNDDHLAARDLGVEVELIGREGDIRQELAKHKAEGLPLSVRHTSQVIEMDEHPAMAGAARCS